MFRFRPIQLHHNLEFERQVLQSVDVASPRTELRYRPHGELFGEHSNCQDQIRPVLHRLIDWQL